MYFKDFNHRETFLELINKYGIEGDNEYTSAFYILSISEIYEKAGSYIDSSGIDFGGIFSKDWPDSMLFLISVAKALFKSSGDVTLSDYLLLDPDNFDIFKEALSIRYNASVIN